jgi:hypothetical protein
MEIANLALKVDSTDISEAGRELGKLTGSGMRAEKATDGLTKSSKMLSQQTKKTTGNVRMMKGGVQQLGFQIQDVAVQAQMGTNAMVILGQQGPQILSIFGPGGAIAGAIIAIGAAVGGTLFASLMKSKSATDMLEESMSMLDATARLTADGVFELTSDLRELAKTSETGAKLQAKAGIVGAIDAIASSATLAREKLDELLAPGFLQNADGLTGVFASLEKNQRNAAEVVDAFYKDSSRFNSILREDMKSSTSSADSMRAGYARLGVVVGGLEKKYGATRAQAIAFAGAFSQINEKSGLNQLRTLQSTLDAIASNSGASDEVIKLSSEIRKFTSEANKAGKKAEGLAGFIANIGKESGLDDVVADITQTVSQFDRLEDRMKEQVALYGVVSLESQIRYRIENGQIESLTEGQGKILIGLAKELDVKKKLTEEARLQKGVDKRRASEQAKSQRIAAAEKERSRSTFQRLIESLDTEEEAIDRSYQRRLAIILKNTEEGSALQDQLIAKLTTNLPEAEQRISNFSDHAARNIQDSLGDAINDLIQGTEDWEKTFLNALVNMVSQAAAADVASFLTGGATGAGNNTEGLVSGAASLFGGFFANGGRPDPHKVSVVGDGGEPEFFVPDGIRGTVVPSSAMSAGSSTNNTFNINYTGTGNQSDDRRAAGALARDINSRLDSGRRYS